jgi:hypothetical protein
MFINKRGSYPSKFNEMARARRVYENWLLGTDPRSSWLDLYQSLLSRNLKAMYFYMGAAIT